jgi:hypothetical protein
MNYLEKQVLQQKYYQTQQDVIDYLNNLNFENFSQFNECKGTVLIQVNRLFRPLDDYLYRYNFIDKIKDYFHSCICCKRKNNCDGLEDYHPCFCDDFKFKLF